MSKKTEADAKKAKRPNSVSVRHGLNEQQALFVLEYLIDLNGTQAAIRAGYSEKNASSIAYQLLKKTPVQEAIQEQMEARARRTLVTADMVVNELAKIGFADIRKMFTPAGHLRSIDGLEDDIAGAVSQVEVVVRPSGERDEDDNPMVEHVHKIKLNDKKGALELLGKHMKMWTDKTEHSGEIKTTAPTINITRE